MIQPPIWTDEQREVVTDDSRARLLIDAGPGTGKTAVLCARIAWLINNNGVTPENIWVISFTRTAVAELRDRIASFLNQREKSSGIRIATVDSYAWSINSGFRSDASISGSFDENISHVISLIKNHEGVFEYLDSIEHLFIDEAQDVVGLRCELLLTLIASIRQDAGMTIFCDEAQAIYGFAKDNKSEIAVGNLPEMLRANNVSVKPKYLSTIHRTEDPVLKQLSKDGRALLLSEENSKDKLLSVRRLITHLNHGPSPVVAQSNSAIFSDDFFLLFRKRGEALAAIKELSDVSLRVRLNGYPNLLKPWIAEIFWDWTNARIAKDVFFERWEQRAQSRYDETPTEEWGKLVRFFGCSASEVDVERLNGRLATQSPPVELCDEYMGSTGPLITTIHASKGRESGSVCLYLPPLESQSFATKKKEGWGSDDPVQEEAKVLFVGATRARHQLYVAEINSGSIQNLKKSGRAYQEIGEKLTLINIEVGRRDDILADGLVGKDLFDSQAAAFSAQKSVSGLYKSYVLADARKGAASFSIFQNSNPKAPLAFLSKEFDYALKEFLYERRLKSYGSTLTGLRILGTRTLAVSQKERLRLKLHHPWNKSGFMFSPVIVGFPSLRVSSRWGGI
jgi:ATP-dependent exoDNAse (exonuclease V) beta subunit